MKNSNQSKLLTVLSCVFLIASCGGGGGSDGGSTPNSTPVVNTPPPVTSTPVVCQQDQIIRFNEVVSSNSTVLDEDGDSPDWFELYSCVSSDTGLFGWSVTDNIDEPEKWVFPEYVMTGNTYLQVWASDKDKVDNSFHTNFKISSEGEALYLFDDLGVLMDSIVVENVPADSSVGISSDDQSLVYYQHTTPGAENSSLSNQGAITNVVEFSNTGGAVSPLSLVLSGNIGAQEIRYTLDSTEPDESSLLYSSPININSNTVVRARVFEAGYLPSPTESYSYLIDASHDIPVISLIVEPDDFFDPSTGIYVYGNSFENQLPFLGANFWDDLEVPINVSFYETDNTLGLHIGAGVKIFGGWSRANDQRSLSLFARNRYGTSEIDYPLFPQLPYNTFQAVVLRNSGNDWLRSMVRDAFMTGLMEGTGLETQAYRPVATYLNGGYWGMYNLREKINEHFIASKHNVDTDDITILEKEGEVIYGDNEEYLALIDYITENSLEGDAEYNTVADLVDIDNFIIYQVAQIYFNNTDWPGNNIKFWKSTEGKWRWILFDTDFGFSIYNPFDYANNTLAFALADNGPDWPNPPWSTLLFRKLMENETFKAKFINQFADELNNRFVAKNVSNYLSSLTQNITSEIPQHFERWQDPLTLETWDQELTKMETFIQERPHRIQNYIQNQLNLPGQHTLSIQISNINQGHVELNSLMIEKNNWEGVYFQSVPVTLLAVPSEGYAFSHWQGDSSSTNAEIMIDLTSDTVISPVFVAQ